MNLVWVTISGKGTADERLQFRATKDLKLQYYAVYDSAVVDPPAAGSTVPEAVLVGQHTCFWFAARQIKSGENIVLYTRPGTPSTETRPDGVYHFLFRGLPDPIYAEPKSCPVLFELITWEARD